MIKPTVGRVVLYSPLDAESHVRHAAIIAHVWSDTTVSLAVFDSNGIPYNRTSVFLYQDGLKPSSNFCEWMEYQKGQAAKTEALEENLKQSQKPASPQQGPS